MAKPSIVMFWVTAILYLHGEVSACCTFCDFCCPSLTDASTNEIRRYCCDGDHSNSLRNAPDECRKMVPGSPPCEDCCDWFDHSTKPIEDPPNPCCRPFPLDMPCKKCYCCLEGNYVEYWCNSKPCSPECVPVASKADCQEQKNGGTSKREENPFGVQSTLNLTNIAALTFSVTAVISSTAQCSFRAVDNTGYVGVNYSKMPLSQYEDGVLVLRPLENGKAEADFDCGCAAQGNGVHQAPHGQLKDVIIECNERVEFINPSVQDCACGASGGSISFCRDGRKIIGEASQVNDCTDYDIDCATCQCGPQPPSPCEGCKCKDILGNCGSYVPACMVGSMFCLPPGTDGTVAPR